MNKEECMLALEQMILELPQYRRITNDICNRYIPIYVKEAYEKVQIYTEGNHNSSKDYCWDIYDTIPISIIESILDNFKEQDDIKKENINLKQSLNDIKEIITDCKKLMPHEFDWKEQADNILQIIDKVLGSDS